MEHNEPSSERLSKLETKLENHAEQMKALSRDLRDKRSDMDGLAQSFRNAIDGLKKEVGEQLCPLIEKINSLESANAAYRAERAIVAFLLGGLVAGGGLSIAFQSNKPTEMFMPSPNRSGGTP